MEAVSTLLEILLPIAFKRVSRHCVEFQPFLRFYELNVAKWRAEYLAVSTLLEILLVCRVDVYTLFERFVFQPFLRFYAEAPR